MLTSEELLARLTEIVHHVFEDDQAIVTRDTTAADVAGWDSLNNIRFLLAVEKHCCVRFDTAEVANLPNIGALIDLVQRKQR